MRLRISCKVWQPFAYVVVIAGIGIGAWFSRDYWLPLLNNDSQYDETAQEESPPIESPKMLKLSEQARANLQLVSKPVKAQSYWRKVQIPGVIVDRPGVTDQGITAPIAGVITQVHAFEGDIIQPNEKLFTLRLVSEYLQKSQSDLFQAVRETEILNKEIVRLRELANAGVIPGKRILELEQQISRQAALLDAFRQDLTSRGLSAEQVGWIESGKFLTTIDIYAPATTESDNEFTSVGFTKTISLSEKGYFEIQKLKVELGQQVDAGEPLAVLANHSSLYIKGHAFKKEASVLADAIKHDWQVEIEFTEDAANSWKQIEQEFQIRHLSNNTDPKSRTIDFFIPLTNQSSVYEKDGRSLVLWRFRPGQRVMIRVPVEKFENVLVMPLDAVIFEGAEAFVFQQNGDLCNRIPVQILHQDSSEVVIRDDGSISPGFYICQCSAAALNRILKAQAASGMRADVHVHADGTTHAAH